jgi:hypothetical protein
MSTFFDDVDDGSGFGIDAEKLSAFGYGLRIGCIVTWILVSVGVALQPVGLDVLTVF